MLIGLCGLAGHGKSTVARFMASELNMRTYALASPIKNFFKALFLWDTPHLYGELKEVPCVTPYITTNEIVSALRTAKIPLEEYYVIMNFFREFQQFVIDETSLGGYPAIQYKISPRKAMQLFGTEVCRSIDDTVWLRCAENAMNETNNKSLIIEDVRFENEAVFVNSQGVLIAVSRKGGAAALNHSSEMLDTAKWSSTTIQNDGGLIVLRNKCQDLVKKLSVADKVLKQQPT